MFLRFVAPSGNSLGFEIHPASSSWICSRCWNSAKNSRTFLGHLDGVQEDAEELAEEWVPAIELLHQLIAEIDVDDVGEFPSGDAGLRSCAEAVIADYKYRSVRCPVCDQTFAPNEISEEEFGYDERVVGGKKYVCPTGHALSVFIRFDTRGTELEPTSDRDPVSGKIEFEHPTDANELIDVLTRAFNAGDKEAIDAITHWGDANDQQKASASQWLADMAGANQIQEIAILPRNHEKVALPQSLNYTIESPEVLHIKYGDKSGTVSICLPFGSINERLYVSARYV